MPGSDFDGLPYSQLWGKAKAVAAEMRAMDAQIIHICTNKHPPRPTPFAECVMVIDGLVNERFKLKQYIQRLITNTEDIAAGRADHIVEEVEEHLEA